MCVTITASDVDPAAPVWDRDTVTIAISRALTPRLALTQIRAMLMWLGAHQRPGSATCWCGEPVQVPGSREVWADVVTERAAEHSRGR